MGDPSHPHVCSIFQKRSLLGFGDDAEKGAGREAGMGSVESGAAQVVLKGGETVTCA
jgi:hypothetical protein